MEENILLTVTQQEAKTIAMNGIWHFTDLRIQEGETT